MSIIFQDPFSSLDPRQSVMQLISEPLIEHKIYKTKDEIKKQTLALMDTVGLARRFVNSYPHELDGGRRQRIGIARALAVNPKLIVCDEPVSALDVSIQAQILNLLRQLQKDMGLTYIFITHDLSVVKYFSDEIAVCTWDRWWRRPPPMSSSIILSTHIQRHCFLQFHCLWWERKRRKESLLQVKLHPL